jgi:acylphosphatase
MSPANIVHHVTIHYSGQVQGVGFRYTTLQIARGHEVCGSVENLRDGRVLIEVEGAREAVEAFLVAIEERMRGFVRHVERVGEQREPRFSGFTIL